MQLADERALEPRARANDHTGMAGLVTTEDPQHLSCFKCACVCVCLYVLPTLCRCSKGPGSGQDQQMDEGHH